MATYGQGKMLGSGINPESFKQDYSGFTRAADIQAQGMANLGASIGGVIKERGDYIKKQGEDERLVKKSLSVAKAIGDLIPDLQPTIQGSLDILNDKEIPLSERKAEAEAISDILNLGISEVRNRQDIGLKERGLAIEEAAALARNAPQRNFKELVLPVVQNGVKGTIRVDQDPNSGQVRTSNGKLFRNIEDAKAQRNAIGQDSGGVVTPEAIDAGLNSGIPASASNAKKLSIAAKNATPLPDSGGSYNPDATSVLLGGGNVSDFPDGVPTTESPLAQGTLLTTTEAPNIQGPPVTELPTTPSSEVATNIDNALGFTPDAPKATVEIITGKTASDVGLKPENTYEVKKENGNIIGYTVLDKATAPTNEADKLKLQESSLRAAGDAAYAIKTINELTSSSGFSDVFGAGIGLKYLPGTSALDAETTRLAIVALATTDSMRKFQGLGSMSDAEFSVARSAATQIAQGGISEEKAAKELNRLRSYFAKSIRQAEELGRIPKGTAEKMITDAVSDISNANPAAAMTSTEALKGLYAPQLTIQQSQ